MGIFCHAKKQVTVPQEFHFATNDRIPSQAAVADMFDKVDRYISLILQIIVALAYEQKQWPYLII